MIRPKKGKGFHFLTDFFHFALEGVEYSDLRLWFPIHSGQRNKDHDGC
jgi:hypothetical protein